MHKPHEGAQSAWCKLITQFIILKSLRILGQLPRFIGIKLYPISMLQRSLPLELFIFVKHGTQTHYYPVLILSQFKRNSDGKGAAQIVLGSRVLFSLQRARERRRVHHAGFLDFGIGPSHSRSRGFIGRCNDREGSTQLTPTTIGMV